MYVPLFKNNSLFKKKQKKVKLKILSFFISQAFKCIGSIVHSVPNISFSNLFTVILQKVNKKEYNASLSSQCTVALIQCLGIV